MGPTDEDWSDGWWGALVAVSLFNIILTLFVCVKQRPSISPETRLYQQRMKYLAWPFVLVCAWRSVLPSIYLTRAAWFDLTLNSVLLARLLAFVAELCWILQLSLAFVRIVQDVDSHCPMKAWVYRVCSFVPKLMWLLIFCAEVCSTFGTITTNSLFFTFEESLWVISYTITFPVAVYLLYLFRSRINPKRGSTSGYYFVLIYTLWGLGYIPWGYSADIPDNVNRYLNERDDPDVHWFSVQDGVYDAWNTRIVSHQWQHWGSYILWMSTYFSAMVWTSILLIYAPRVERDGANALGKQLLQARDYLGGSAGLGQGSNGGPDLIIHSHSPQHRTHSNSTRSSSLRPVLAGDL